MEKILFQYEMPPTTWVYLSALLIVSLFFKFNRLWSVRNLDLLGLIALAPGLLCVAQGQGLGPPGIGQSESVVQFGYLWLFTTGLFFLVRLLGDPMMVRRPLLEPNLAPGGMAFIGVALLIFLMANVITGDLTENDLEGARRLDALLKREQPPQHETSLTRHGPGYPLLHMLPGIPSKMWTRADAAAPGQPPPAWAATARAMAIMSHLAVVVALVLIGYRHFQNIRTGIAVATIYLLLPYTAQMTGRVDHVLPAALLVWAVAAYRRPLVSGILLGLAAGVIYYPVFLLPLWLAFYWQRGLFRFLAGFASMVLLLVGTLAFTSSDLASFLAQVNQMFGFTSLFESLEHVDGFWDANKSAYRITVFAAFLALSGSLAIWPAQKNLGTLLSCSAAVMLGTQFWHAQGGGLYMAWYLPLLLLTVFRPNLEDRVALSVLDISWFDRRRQQLRPVEKAA